MAGKKRFAPFYSKEVTAMEKRGEVIIHKSAHPLVIGQRIVRANNKYLVVIHKLVEVYHRVPGATYYTTTVICKAFDGNIFPYEEFEKNRDKMMSDILNEYKDKYGYDLTLYPPKYDFSFRDY